ncbi:ATP-binding protein [Lactococcus termiticola]|uniref:HerA helicase n=1 Tax=Lactococcus termiticola TaxID=2169526 RepID=A0A2R5HHI4_9LACT|nr:ATP-binding protein [Lactococcus termiticola]GBG97316.1 HerA helicase [Lactococcus termiticola]
MNTGKKEDVYPEIAVDIIGLLEGEYFKLSGFKTVGITDKVYIANEKLISKYLKSLEVHYYKNQKPLEKLAHIAGFESEYLSLQPNTLFDRHLMAIGTTNSGKSTSALSILDKLVTSGRKVLLIDPTGEYRNSFSDDEMEKLTLGADTILPIAQVSIQQWEQIFQTNDNTQGATLSKAIHSLRYQKKTATKGILTKKNCKIIEIDEKLSSVQGDDKEFILSDLPAQIAAESVKIGEARNNSDIYVEATFNLNNNNWLVDKVQHVLNNSSFMEFFGSDLSKKNLIDEIDTFVKSKSSSLYIDASAISTSDGIGAMIIDVIANCVINKNKSEVNPFVLFTDEVHRYTSKTNDLYQTGLISVAREGRKKGIFLFLTTQNPKDVPEVLLGQIGSLIIHRLTYSEEIKAIQNCVKENTISQISKLNRGEAILTSINLLQDISVKFEKSSRLHENSTPTL